MVARIVLVDASVDGPDMVTVCYSVMVCVVEFTLSSLGGHFGVRGPKWSTLDMRGPEMVYTLCTPHAPCIS